MPEAGFDLEDYQANLYLMVLRQLSECLPKVKEFIARAETERDPGQLEQLAGFYETLMGAAPASAHLRFEIARVYKPFYLRDPGPFDKHNSYYHLTLQPASSSIIALDALYGGRLSHILKLYLHTFSKINHYFMDFEQAQLTKYAILLEQVGKEINLFLENTAHREILEQKEKLKEQHLSRIPFGALFNVAHIDNLPGIMQLGILSHNKAHGEGMVRMDISNQSVNNLRDRVAASLGSNLHDYAPVYINPRNATFYYWCKTKPKTEVVLFKINPNILLAPDVAFSDGNAAVSSTQFYQNIDDFNRLDWAGIHEEWWANHPDGKRIKCAEVLVKGLVPLHYIDEIYVYDQVALEKVLPLFPNHLSIRILVNPAFYFN